MSTRRRIGALVATAMAVAATATMASPAAPAAAAEPAFVTFARPVTVPLEGEVAVGDVDLDGAPDLVRSDVVAHAANTIEVARGLGDGTFLPSITSPTAGVGFDQTSLVDVNGDDLLDLVGLDASGSEASIALGDGTGHFGGITQVSLSMVPRSMVVTDLDADGDVDLAATGGSIVRVLLGAGDGTFAAPLTESLPQPTGAIAAGDVDGDAVLDLILIAGGVIYVLPGEGGGGFGPATTQGSTGSVSVALDDLDGDDVLDVVTTNSGAAQIVIGIGQGDGTFSYTNLPSSLSCQCAVSTGDLNADGAPELVVSAYGDPGGVAVHVGRGDGTFVPGTNFPLELGSVARIADLDADELPDIAVGSYLGTAVLVNTPGLPQPPAISSATGGPGSATISWTAPSPGASPITGYVLTPYPVFGAPTAPITFASTSTTQTVIGLTNGQQYFFRVAAINALGLGQESRHLSNVVTAGFVPAAPTIGSAVAGDTSVRVSWSPPPANGGPPVTGYKVTPYVGFFPLPAITYPASARSRLITGLTNGTTYRFKIAAVNAVGTGAASTASPPATPFVPSPPGAPTIATATTSGLSAVVSWTAPASTGGAAITGYVVTPYLGAVAQSSRTFFTPATSQTITGLIHAATYTFTVAATNVAGTGAPSAASNPVTPMASVPGAPTMGAVVAGNQSATVSWTAPAGNGGASITAYRVTPFIGYYAMPSTTFASTVTTQVVTGLANGTTYRFKVTAINIAGPGAPSGASAPVIPGV